MDKPKKTVGVYERPKTNKGMWVTAIVLVVVVIIAALMLMSS